MLYRSNKLMYDRGTNTLWNQFLGEPAVGPLADSGIKLELLPVLVTSWADWLKAHPDTTVLDIETGIYSPASYRREEDIRSAYFHYRNDEDAIFPVARRDDRLLPKAQLLGLRFNGVSKAYPLDVLIEEKVVNDSVGGQDLVVVTTDQGGGARVYDRGTHRFRLVRSEVQPESTGNRSGILLDRQGRRWQVREEALVSLDGSSDPLLRLPSHMAYWFGWYAFNADTEVYGKK